MTEDQKEIFDIELGEEPEPLTAQPVTVEEIGLRSVEYENDAGEEESRNILVLSCSHPDRDDPVNLSTVKYEKNGRVEQGAIWFYQDSEDGTIPYNSALGHLLRFYDCRAPNDLEGEEIETAEDENGYLVAKAI